MGTAEPALHALNENELHNLQRQIQRRLDFLAANPGGAVGTYSVEKGIGSRPMSPEEILTKIFSYHDDPRKIPNYVAIRTAAKHFAEVILQNLPSCPDRTRALIAVKDSVMLANAAIALDGLSFDSL